jgi:hypothetical protein
MTETLTTGNVPTNISTLLMETSMYYNKRLKCMCWSQKEQKVILEKVRFNEQNLQRQLRSSSADCKAMLVWYKNPYNKDVTRVRDIGFDGDSQ